MNLPGPHLAPRILLVEDDDALREVIGDCLRGLGYLVDEAGDGLAALEVSACRAPDAVVLDLVMPRLDGWGFLSRFREDDERRAVPVLITTGAVLDDPGELGAAGFLQKPFDMRALVEKVGELAPAPGPTPGP